MHQKPTWWRLQGKLLWRKLPIKTFVGYDLSTPVFYFSQLLNVCDLNASGNFPHELWGMGGGGGSCVGLFDNIFSKVPPVSTKSSEAGTQIIIICSVWVSADDARGLVGMSGTKAFYHICSVGVTSIQGKKLCTVQTKNFNHLVLCSLFIFSEPPIAAGPKQYTAPLCLGCSAPVTLSSYRSAPPVGT